MKISEKGKIGDWEINYDLLHLLYTDSAEIKKNGGIKINLKRREIKIVGV